MVLTALPFIVATLLIMFNPEYFRPMIENRTGHFMILYALVSIVLGHIVIQRIVRIEV
jgi:tight adherence protein B